jgi:queuine tRNA-ribosyltransferase
MLAVVYSSAHEGSRAESVGFANDSKSHGFVIGGLLGQTKSEMHEAIEMTSNMLDKNKFAYLPGVGDIESIFRYVLCGVDLFGCAMPTRLARHGIAITKASEAGSDNFVRLKSSLFRSDSAPISETCGCYACQNFTRAYISHLFNAREALAGTLTSIHNIYAMNGLMADIRKGICEGALDATAKGWLAFAS